jgi:putative methyltransferase (TIGR04325 family)
MSGLGGSLHHLHWAVRFMPYPAHSHAWAEACLVWPAWQLRGWLRRARTTSGAILRRFARATLPPFLLNPLRWAYHLAVRPHAEWEYVPEGWGREQRDPNVGWDSGVVDAHRAIWNRWLEAVEGSGPLGVDFWRYMREAQGEGELERNLGWAHNHVMTFGYVLARTAQAQETISVLDWGGGVGQYYPLARALLPDVQMDYHCKDVPVLSAAGRELLPEITFYDDDSCLNRRYDLVLASGSLQYVKSWRDALRGLAGATQRYLLLTRTTTVAQSPSFVVVQRPQPYGFGSDVLERFLNRDEVLECADGAGLRLVREFVMLDETPAAGVPEQARYRGFLFESASCPFDPCPSRPRPS